MSPCVPLGGLSTLENTSFFFAALRWPDMDVLGPKIRQLLQLFMLLKNSLQCYFYTNQQLDLPIIVGRGPKQKVEVNAGAVLGRDGIQ